MAKKPYLTRAELCVALGLTEKDLQTIQTKWKTAKPLGFLSGELYHLSTVRQEIEEAGFPC